MFKKFVLFISLACSFLLVACGGNNNVEPTSVPATVTEAVAQLEATATPEPSPTPTATFTATPEPTETPTPEPTDTPVPTATKAPVAPTRPRPTPVPTRENNNDDATPESGNAAAFPDGTDLLERARLNTSALETVRIKQVLAVEMTEGGLAMDITCDISGLDFYCLMESTTDLGVGEPVIQVIEIARLGEQTWSRTGDTDWVELPPELAATMSPETIISPPLNSATYEAEVVNETILDGYAVYEVILTFDQESVVEVLRTQNPALTAGADIEVVEATSSVWVGQDDLLLYRQSMTMDYLVEGQPFLMTSQLSYSLHNQPIELPDPTAE